MQMMFPMVFAPTAAAPDCAAQCCNVYVTNLSLSITLRLFREVFGRAGTIVSARIVPRRRGFAPVGFVQYVAPHMVQAAIELLDGLEMEGSVLSVAMAKRNKDKGIENEPSPRLYVANLPNFYAEQDVFCLFSPFGPIQWLKLVRHRYSGASKGAALIQFAMLGSAIAAKEAMHYRWTEAGMLLEVKFAESTEERMARKEKPSHPHRAQQTPCSPASPAGSSTASSVGFESSNDQSETEAMLPETPSGPPRRRWSV